MHGFMNVKFNIICHGQHKLNKALNLRLTSYTASFNIQKFCVLPTLHLCVLRGSQNKQRLLRYIALTGWLIITEAESVYCAVRTGSLNQTDTVTLLMA